MKRFFPLSLLVPESDARYRKGNEVTSYYRKMFQTEKLQGFIANFENAKLSRTDESKQLDLAEASGFDPTTIGSAPLDLSLQEDFTQHRDYGFFSDSLGCLPIS